MDIRELRAQARRDLHTTLSRPAAYYAEGRTDTPPRLIHVRLHTKTVEQGDSPGSSFDYAKREDTAPRVIFDVVEVPDPGRNDIVMLTDDEGYRVSHTEPQDGMTISAEAARMIPVDTTTYAGPSAIQ